MFLSGINCKVDIFVKLLDFPLLIHIEHKNGHKQSPFQLVPGIGKTETLSNLLHFLLSRVCKNIAFWFSWSAKAKFLDSWELAMWSESEPVENIETNTNLLFF